VKEKPEASNAVDEPVYTPEELAKAKKLHVATVRKLFMEEPDVIRFGHPATGRRRQYYTLRIPSRVAARVFGRMTVGGQA
jgi:hypothetical protein